MSNLNDWTVFWQTEYVSEKIPMQYWNLISLPWKKELENLII